MPTLERTEDGIWRTVGSRGRAQLGDSIHDEALVRYLTAFDPAFTRARDESEFEFILTLLRVRGVQDAGWDPFVSTREAIDAVRGLHERIAVRDENFAVARHLQLWTYGHIVEASEPYEILANLLDIARGGSFVAWRFPDRDGRPQPVGRKIETIERQALAAGIASTAKPLREMYDQRLRNAVFHADYSLRGGEVRLPREGTRYPHEQVLERVNRALAYFDALTILFDAHVASHGEPVRIPVSPTFARGANEEATVIVRRGYGVVGMKHSLTDADVAAGGIQWRVGIFTPEELALLEADPHLALLPDRATRRMPWYRRLGVRVREQLVSSVHLVKRAR
jgi:hypothetical protein